MIPSFVAKTLWDTPLANISFPKHAKFVVERVLEYGDLDAYHWARKQLGDEIIRETLRTSKRLTPKSANFYATILEVPKEEVLCLQTLSTLQPNKF